MSQTFEARRWWVAAPRVIGQGAVLIVVLAVLLMFGVIELDDRLNPPWMEANAFLKAIGRSGPQAAYDRAAPEFRAAITADDFAALTVSRRLDQVKSGGWNDRRFTLVTADMGGIITFKTGERVPAIMRLKRDGLAWKVVGAEFDGAAPIGPPALGLDMTPLRRAQATRTQQPGHQGALDASYATRVQRAPDVDLATGVVIAHPPDLNTQRSP